MRNQPELRTPTGPRASSSHKRWQASSAFLPPEDEQDPSELTPLSLPARVTLMNPVPPHRTPFDHYKAGPQPAPKPNPYRFIQKRLGLSEEAFEARIQVDVEELFAEIAEDKMREEVSQSAQGEVSTSTAPNPDAPKGGSSPRTNVTTCCTTKPSLLAPCWECSSGRPIWGWLVTTSRWN